MATTIGKANGRDFDDGLSTAMQTLYSTVHDKCTKVSDAETYEEDIPIAESHYLLPPGFAGHNGAFNNGASFNRQHLTTLILTPCTLAIFFLRRQDPPGQYDCA